MLQIEEIPAKPKEQKTIRVAAYLLTALYNAPATINHYYQAAVQHDLYSDSS